MLPITYCDDEMMAYGSARKVFEPGERVVFDEGYGSRAFLSSTPDILPS